MHEHMYKCKTKTLKELQMIAPADLKMIGTDYFFWIVDTYFF